MVFHRATVLHMTVSTSQHERAVEHLRAEYGPEDEIRRTGGGRSQLSWFGAPRRRRNGLSLTTVKRCYIVYADGSMRAAP